MTLVTGDTKKNSKYRRFTHEAVICAHPCQTPAHFKRQHEDENTGACGSAQRAAREPPRTSPGRTVRPRRASPHRSPISPCLSLPLPARCRPVPAPARSAGRGGGSRRRGSGAHPRGGSAPCRPTDRLPLCAGPGGRPGARRQLPAGDARGEEPPGALRPLNIYILSP